MHRGSLSSLTSFDPTQLGNRIASLLSNVVTKSIVRVVFQGLKSSRRLKDVKKNTVQGLKEGLKRGIKRKA